MRKGVYGRTLVRDIIEWDVASWKGTLDYWDARVPDLHGARVLEIGSRHGGLALHFALKGCRVVASDASGPSVRARELHARYGVSDRIVYEQADALHLPHADGCFDVVSFKSVLGEIGSYDNRERQRQALAEMRRVLRNGGRLLFAENTQATAVHGLLRRAFTPWGTWWRYLPAHEVAGLFGEFGRLDVAFHGFAAALGRSERQRRLLHLLDTALEPALPARWKYVVFGCATK